MKEKVYTIANSKGGCTKTSCTFALMHGLTLKGYKVLAIDLDSQKDLTIAATGDDSSGRNEKVGSLHVLTGETPAADAVIHTEYGDLIPAERGLAGSDSLITGTGREYRLREAVELLKGSYDFVLIDTQPILSVTVANALTAADRVIIPTTPDRYTITGIQQLNESIVPIRKYCNSALQIEGILISRYSPRSVMNREMKGMLEQIAGVLNTKVFRTTIREAQAVRESQLMQKSIYDYAPRAKVTQDYRDFVDEFLEGRGDHEKEV